MREWSPSTWGRKFTGSKDWILRLNNDSIDLTVAGLRHSAAIQIESPLRIRQGIFWTNLTLHPGESRQVVVDGIPNRHGSDISAAIQTIVDQLRVEAQRRIEAELRTTRRERFHGALLKIQAWRKEMVEIVQRANAELRWITREHLQGFLNSKPVLPMTAIELQELLADQDVREFLGDRVKEAESTVAFWVVDLAQAVDRRNEVHSKAELEACQSLFNRVESKPLTEEQARAVICFDNRVQVVASAGSGKTSTMVAKAAYAIHRKIISPERIVLLAFNGSAAEELDERAKRSFKRLGMEDVQITAKTFHSLGRYIIGQVTGRKPHVPEWAGDEASGAQKLGQLIDDLKDRSVTFRAKWDMFRLVFGHDVPRFGAPEPEEAWDSANRRGGSRTLQGEVVKSMEECVIANWLFYNGVTYVYERNYEFDTATADHSQYRPDFYYPAIELYHEHFALNKREEAPPAFKNYMEGVRWKRSEHRRRGTQLIETTSHQLWSGQLFEHLARELESRGIQLDPNPDRSLPKHGEAPVEHAELVELVRCFIRHAKSNGLTQVDLVERLNKMPDDSFRHRHRLFLELAEPIREAWDAALADEKGIDFEDMLNQAAEHLEQRRFESPFDLVLADEFQDASWARARLCLGLVKEPGRHLFAVGDDWQSINRFAGADVSVMTGFEDWCGQGHVLRLEETFRCPQALCDVSSHFVSKNPTQISKKVRSNTPSHGPVLQAFQVSHPNQIQSAIRDHMVNLHQVLDEGTAQPGQNGKVSVFVLGRYKADRKYVPDDWKSEFGDLIDVRFSSVHSSKGGEADYIILPGMVRRGFPNLRREDPVLSLAMPGSDNYYLSEERRLFYVALTRARRSVAMFTVQGHASVFLDELVADGFVTITDVDGKPIQERRCSVCKQGIIVQRTGRYGPFFSCSNFPSCNHKPKV